MPAIRRLVLPALPCLALLATAPARAQTLANAPDLTPVQAPPGQPPAISTPPGTPLGTPPGTPPGTPLQSRPQGQAPGASEAPQSIPFRGHACEHERPNS